MFKHAALRVTLTLALALLIAPVNRAIAATNGPAASTPTAIVSSSGPTQDGVTGTDPEPTDPGVIQLILALLRLT